MDFNENNSYTKSVIEFIFVITKENDDLQISS
jgi:hypothetical protein